MKLFTSIFKKMNTTFFPPCFSIETADGNLLDTTQSKRTQQTRKGECVVSFGFNSLVHIRPGKPAGYRNYILF